MKICIIGLGKIGLPLSVQCALKGFETFGVDINPLQIETIKRGETPYEGETSLDNKLRQVIDSQKLKVTDSLRVGVENADVIVVIVPLMVDATLRPDFENIDNVTKDIATSLRPGQLVIYETTLPIGTTRNRFVNILNSNSNLKAGIDFFVAYSPERVSSGSVFEDLQKYPKIVGGINPESSGRAESFYRQILDFSPRPDLPRENGVWIVKDSETGEFIKLAETTFRDVNIALANVFFMHSDYLGLDFQEISEAANSQPFSKIHQAGISVGGHCIPVYPHFYLETDEQAELIRIARQINRGMPEFFVKKILENLASIKDSKILILGLAYRPGVKEHSFSGAFEISRIIKNLGGIPLVTDPLYESREIEALGIDSWKEEKDIEFVILNTAHKEFYNFNFSKLHNLRGIVDGRNFFSKEMLGDLLL